MLQYKRIGITVKSGLSDKDKAISPIISILEKEGAEILVDGVRLREVLCTKDFPIYTNEGDIDLLLVAGGDGTILRTIREMKDFSIPILSVNKGTIGFLAEISMNEAEDMIPKLLHGTEGVVEERSILKITAQRKNETVFSGYALNEAVIAQGTIARLVNLQTTINGEPLTTYHADGLILSTPTGSTAYSLAAGGPIVHPGQSSTILTPINPHSFSQKPIVIRGDSLVEVQVLTKENKFSDTEVILTLDGQTYVTLKKNDIVQARNSHNTVKFLRRAEDTFYSTLREKLKWGERLEN